MAIFQIINICETESSDYVKSCKAIITVDKFLLKKLQGQEIGGVK